MKPLKKLLCYLTEYKKECVLGPLFKLLEASFELLVPLVMAAIISEKVHRSVAALAGAVVRCSPTYLPLRQPLTMWT